MARKTDNQEDAAPRVIISVSGGVADVLFKPKGINVTIFDYDVEGGDESAARLSKDPDGEDCCISEWPSDEKVVGNERWPLIKQATRCLSHPYEQKWKCPECSRVVSCSYEHLAEVGSPYCVDCDIEMRLV